jgi:hypothetical protein
MHENLAKIRIITIYYSHFLGLRSVVIGIFLAVSMLPKQGDLTIPCSLLPLAILAYIWVDRYYARTYGRVKPRIKDRNRQIIIYTGLGVFSYLAFVLDTEKILPVSAVGLVLASITFIGFLGTTDEQRKDSFVFFPEIFIAAFILAIVSLLPLTGFIWWQELGLQSLVSGVLVVDGILLTLSGIWAHLRLTRTLTPGEESVNGNTL